MGPDSSDLVIHSVTEARLYAKVAPCPSCEGGPTAICHQSVEYDIADCRLLVPVHCRACDQRAVFVFSTKQIERCQPVYHCLFELREPASLPAAQVINPWPEPSHIIDLPNWLTLHMLSLEHARLAGLEARTMRDRGITRRYQVEARYCLDEALKFYSDDDELPGPAAFFGRDQLQRLFDHPELFVRSRLISLRDALPVGGAEG
jgi:hypothetical protein